MAASITFSAPPASRKLPSALSSFALTDRGDDNPPTAAPRGELGYAGDVSLQGVAACDASDGDGEGWGNASWTWSLTASKIDWYFMARWESLRDCLRKFAMVACCWSTSYGGVLVVGFEWPMGERIFWKALDFYKAVGEGERRGCGCTRQ